MSSGIDTKHGKLLAEMVVPGDDVVFTIKDINNGGETSLHYSHIKNLDSTIRTLVSECCDQKIKAL